jgi:flagellar basal-body rod protein FlgC
MNTIAKNLANVDTTRTEEGGPYQREIVIISEKKSANKFQSILDDLKSQVVQTDQNHMESSYYQRKFQGQQGGAQVEAVEGDNSPSRLKYDPNHPDANENGYVRMPNINVVTELVDIMGASRAYEANLTVIDAAKKIVSKSLEI